MSPAKMRRFVDEAYEILTPEVSVAELIKKTEDIRDKLVAQRDKLIKDACRIASNPEQVWAKITRLYAPDLKKMEDSIEEMKRLNELRNMP